jgi:hypothetical protein
MMRDDGGRLGDELDDDGTDDADGDDYLDDGDEGVGEDAAYDGEGVAWAGVMDDGDFIREVGHAAPDVDS